MTHQAFVVAALGTAQTLSWASTYYLPAIVAAPLAADLGVGVPTVFAAFSAALVLSALSGPHAGRAIDRWGGRPVLAASSLVFAAGLLLLAGCTGSTGLFVAWLVLGAGMGAGLYEGAFASLVRLYGAKARKPITGITLIAGFASTIGWPLSALGVEQFGWRPTCMAWAAAHLLLGLPLNLLLPRACIADASPAAAGATPAAGPPARTTALLAFVFAATWFVSTAMAAHLPRLLQAFGTGLAAAVAVGALVGPSQVAARWLEFGLMARIPPLLSARLAALMHPLGAALLGLSAPWAAPLFGVLHGAGNGVLTIAKGTLPLALFGPRGYGGRQGLLLVPARLAQAAAPWLFGLALDQWGRGALFLSAGLSLAALAALLALRRQPARD